MLDYVFFLISDSFKDVYHIVNKAVLMLNVWDRISAFVILIMFKIKRTISLKIFVLNERNVHF